MGRSEEIEKAARKTIKLIRELAGYEVGSMHPNDFAVRDEEVTHDVLRLHAEHGAALWKWRWKMGRSEVEAAPKFGARYENTVASMDNPHRCGMFVRAVRIPVGCMNAGTWWEMTDGRGKFWQSKPANMRAIPPAEVGAARERFTDAAYRYWMWQRRGRSAGMGTVQERHRTVSAAFDALLAAEQEEEAPDGD